MSKGQYSALFYLLLAIFLQIVDLNEDVAIGNVGTIISVLMLLFACISFLNSQND